MSENFERIIGKSLSIIGTDIHYSVLHRDLGGLKFSISPMHMQLNIKFKQLSRIGLE